jgi:hypothetical protein
MIPEPDKQCEHICEVIWEVAYFKVWGKTNFWWPYRQENFSSPFGIFEFKTNVMSSILAYD